MNAKLLKKLLDMGHHVAVKGKSGRYTIFYTMDDTYLYVSIAGNSKEPLPLREAVNCCTNVLWSAEGVEESFTSDYIIITPTPCGLEVGDKVRIVGTDYDIGKVREINEDGTVYIGGYISPFPQTRLIPVIEETPTEEEINKAKETLEKAGLIKEGKIITE